MHRSENTLPPLNHIPAEVICASDYELLAPNFIAPDRMAYISGGSGHDLTLKRNLRALSDYSIIPRVMTDLDNGNTKTELLGQPFQHPIFLAPVAYQALVHSQAEVASACAAEATDSCMIASTLSSASLEQIAEYAGSDRWFQLYFQPREEDTHSLIQRAITAGYKAIVVTVDAAIQAPSLRAIRAGFKFPRDIKPANTAHQKPTVPPAITSDQNPVFQRYMQNAPSREQLKKLINESTVPVIIKGVLHPEDAQKLKAMGAAGIIVSNHGGRTLDGAPSSLSTLPAIREAVGEEFPLLLDSGIRSGSDIFKAIALGADAVLIGRLQVYALSVAGALGVAHMIKLLREELELCMAISGCASLQDITAGKLFRSVEG